MDFLYCDLDVGGIATICSAVATAFMAVMTWVSIRRSKKQFDEQTKDLKRQNFENEFRSRISEFVGMKDKVGWAFDDVEVYGIEVFKMLFQHYNKLYDHNSGFAPVLRMKESFEGSEDNASNIGGYYCSLLSLLVYVNVGCDGMDTTPYLHRVKMSLTTYEIKWLGLYCKYVEALEMNNCVLYDELVKVGIH